jgi:hypothetical protein
MRVCDCVFVRSGPLLAINIFFLLLWGFAGIGKVLSGYPDWFPSKFGPTFMATFPGLKATYWTLTAAELAAFALGVIALFRLEFLREPLWLSRMLAWSLFVFIMLAFGLWLTQDPVGGFQQFCYFSGTTMMLFIVQWTTANRPAAKP